MLFGDKLIDGGGGFDEIIFVSFEYKQKWIIKEILEHRYRVAVKKQQYFLKKYHL